ncbi:MAG: HNH endonuclease [Planctomycetota bacterium]|jgi:hypothetical protein
MENSECAGRELSTHDPVYHLRWSWDLDGIDPIGDVAAFHFVTILKARARRFIKPYRSKNRCEYCRLQQDAATFLRFHIEHIQARQHIRDDSSDNLALACPDCNRHKGPNLTTLELSLTHGALVFR